MRSAAAANRRYPPSCAATVSSSTPPVLGSEPLLVRMLGNLVENGIRHNRTGGWVDVGLDVVDRSVRVIVTNSGPVVAVEQISGVFEPFQRLDRDRVASSILGSAPAAAIFTGRDVTDLYQEAAMSDSVYRVTEIIGTSSESWEQATRNAVETASATVRDLRVAEVVKLDVTIDDGKLSSYRARLNISFKYVRAD
jgi:flavin-binding protein dodecin